MTTREEDVLHGLAEETEADARELPRARGAKDARRLEMIEGTLRFKGAQLSITTRTAGVLVGELVEPLDANGRAAIAAWGAGRVEVAIEDVLSVSAIEATRDVYQRIAARQRERFGKGDGHG